MWGDRYKSCSHEASPEMSGIALGLFCALGIFALKTAVGNYYFLALPGQPFRKTAAVILMQSAYALVFVLAFGLLGRFDFLQAANAGSFLKNGVLIHKSQTRIRGSSRCVPITSRT